MKEGGIVPASVESLEQNVLQLVVSLEGKNVTELMMLLEGKKTSQLKNVPASVVSLQGKKSLHHCCH